MTALEDTPELAPLVRAGGYPFITLTVVEPETGKIELTTAGLTTRQIIGGLREAADQLAQAQVALEEARERARQA